MTTTITFGLGSALLLLTAAFTGRVGPAGEEHSSFLGEVHGAMTATPRGDATFGSVPAEDGRPGSFSLSLGARGDDGAVLFTRASGARLSIGTYQVSANDDGTDDIRALVVTGSPTRPTGVFQAQQRRAGDHLGERQHDPRLLPAGGHRLPGERAGARGPDGERCRHLRGGDRPLRPAPVRANRIRRTV